MSIVHPFLFDGPGVQERAALLRMFTCQIMAAYEDQDHNIVIDSKLTRCSETPGGVAERPHHAPGRVGPSAPLASAVGGLVKSRISRTDVWTACVQLPLFEDSRHTLSPVLPFSSKSSGA